MIKTKPNSYHLLSGLGVTCMYIASAACQFTSVLLYPVAKHLFRKVTGAPHSTGMQVWTGRS